MFDNILSSLFSTRKTAPASIADTMTTPLGPLHPFYPLGVELANYNPNDTEVLELLILFLGGWAVIMAITWAVVSKVSPKMKIIDKMALMWFVLTGCIHFFFEGYFSYNHWRMPAQSDFFGQLWKEYAMSDSRYLTSDAFVLCMETVTAFMWGPLSFVTVYLILTSHPLRYTLQLIVCMGQIYGDILYYATALFDLYYKNTVYCRPEGYYFWFYFFFMNFIWIVIPGFFMGQSIVKTTSAFSALNRINGSILANGSSVKPKANGHIKSS